MPDRGTLFNALIFIQHLLPNWPLPAELRTKHQSKQGTVLVCRKLETSMQSSQYIVMSMRARLSLSEAKVTVAPQGLQT